MGSKNSSEETRDRARRLAEEIGAHHLEIAIDPIVAGFEKTVVDVKEPNSPLF